jgi:hypothetical protein
VRLTSCQAALPFEELIASPAIHYRCPVKHKIFSSYEACQLPLAKLIARGEAEPDAAPVVVHALDSYLPVLGREGLGSGVGALPSLRAVLVLEDLGQLPDETPNRRGSQGGGEQVAGGGQARGGAAEEKEAPQLPPQVTFPTVTMPGAGSVGGGDVLGTLTMLEIEKRRMEWEAWRHREVSSSSRGLWLRGTWAELRLVQELEWANRLRAKEAAKMEELERAFLEREKERNGLFAKTQEEYAKLETKLRKALTEVRQTPSG